MDDEHTNIQAYGEELVHEQPAEGCTLRELAALAEVRRPDLAGRLRWAADATEAAGVELDDWELAAALVYLGANLPAGKRREEIGWLRDLRRVGLGYRGEARRRTFETLEHAARAWMVIAEATGDGVWVKEAEMMGTVGR